MHPRPRLEVILMWRALVGSGWLDSGCLVLRADTRENPWGKNGVITITSSLFGVSWHKERQTKNKLLDFCPLRFSRFSCPLTVVAQFVSVCMPVLVDTGLQKDIPRVKEDRTRYEKVARSLRWQSGAKRELEWHHGTRRVMVLREVPP